MTDAPSPDGPLRSGGPGPAPSAPRDPERLVDWFTRPAPGRPGLLNLAYNALDRHVVRGLADEPALLHPFALAGQRSRYSYAELLEQTAQLAGGMVQLGVRPGGRVVLVLDRVPELVVALLACARLGAVAVPVGLDVFDADPGTIGRLLQAPAALSVVDGERKVAVAVALDAAGLRPPFTVALRPPSGTLTDTGDVDLVAMMKPGQFEAGVCAELSPDAPFLTVPDASGSTTFEHGWTVALAVDADARGLGPDTFVTPAPGSYADLLAPLLAGAAVELR